MMNATVRIYLTINDGPALIEAARKWLVDNDVAVDMEAAAGILDAEDYGAALRYLLDPGLSVPGAETEDCDASVEEAAP